MPRLGKAARRERILRELERHPHVRISELAANFGVSTETVRRDVEALSSEGLISRAYGGASAIPMGAQAPFSERNQAYIEERARIGERAAAMVRPGEVLMVDAGSTTHQFAMALAVAGQDLTVLTNSVAIAATLGQNGSIQIILCPGDFQPLEAAVYGPETLDFLSRYNANRAFIGASGLSVQGISDANRSAVAVKRRMIGQSRETFLLIDHSKFDRHLVATVEPLGALAGIVCDRKPSGTLGESVARAGIDVQIA
ncbi:DeoR/GlpR family DNA-binding transcription regulator [Amorphus coralli]|uniref:DeoR/GlpR family DNA-binding transcription regulator n=1 Tax=Amorphus coralli TaxID=340680 RepID=UPI0003778129|nr:DeoR/GlpR family DNA-binding transcription regulator [Amorphus coralli]